MVVSITTYLLSVTVCVFIIPSLSTYINSLCVLPLLTCYTEPLQSGRQVRQAGQGLVSDAAAAAEVQMTETCQTCPGQALLQRRLQTCGVELRQLTVAGQSRHQVGSLQH